MPADASDRAVVGLLIAAGRGRRFVAASNLQGGTVPDKLLAPLAGRAVVRHACDALVRGCDAVIAVIRADASAALRAELASVRCVEAASADLGMGHSLATAAQEALRMEAGAVVILPADMPWVLADTVRRVRQALLQGTPEERAQRIVVPTLPDGRTGHPVGFGAGHLPALARLSGERGARALLDAHRVQSVPVTDAGILRDVDTPSDLPP